MKFFRVAILLLIVSGAVILLWRHQTLRRLNSEQRQLERQLESNSQTVPAAPIASAAANAGLSAAERSELLRLRGEAGSLRQQLTQATNELARLSRAARSNNSSAPQPSNEETAAHQRMGRSYQAMRALLRYAGDHAQHLPDTLTEAASYVGPDAAILDELEFLQPGLDLSIIGSPDKTIVLREKDATLMGDGQHWSRNYAFADGHIEAAVSLTNDFTAWEEKHRPAAADRSHQ